MSCAARSAWTSEKPMTRSGRKAATGKASAVEKPPMTGRGSRPSCEAKALTATTSVQASRRAQMSADSALRQMMRIGEGSVGLGGIVAEKNAKVDRVLRNAMAKTNRGFATHL